MGNLIQPTTYLQPTTQESAVNVKLQTQQVPIFNGSPSAWKKWKKKTKATLGTTRFLSVMDDYEYVADELLHT